MDNIREEKGHDLHIPLAPEFGFDSMYWQKYLELARDQDRELVAELNVQLDSLLIFAGLFSGVNTGFIVLAFTLLGPSASDQTNELLRLLLSQANSTLLEMASPPWKLDPVSVRITCFFSASLSCGLLASMGAVLGKQWLSYYQRAGQTGSLSDRVFQRQKKFDAIEAYPCHSFLMSLSVLLQLGLLFFLLGLIDYTWEVNRTVSYVIISFVGFGLMVYMYTLLAAIQDPHCPFQSPGATIARSLALSIRFMVLSFLRKYLDRLFKEKSSLGDENLVAEDGRSVFSGVTRSVAPSIVDRILNMPFQDFFQAIPIPDQNNPSHFEVSKGAQDDEAELADRLTVYAKSIRRILETTSAKETLFAAAANIPTLRRGDITRRIFSDPDFSLTETMAGLSLKRAKGTPSKSGFGTNSAPRAIIPIHESRPYVLLLSLFRESLERFIVLRSAKNGPNETVESVVIYGRALCHALISSPAGLEGFARLSAHLNEFSILAWMGDIAGELRLLLMCALNHPRSWMSLDITDESWGTIEPSALPIYIACVSVVSIGGSKSNRDHWVTRMGCLSLTVSTPTPRVIGLVARTLIQLDTIDMNEVEHIINNIWHSYSSDVNYVWDIVAALQIYLANVGSIPDAMEAYSALVTAFKGSVEELYKRPDDIYSCARRRRRQRHRHELRTVGPDLLRSLENIAFDLSNRIELLSYPLVDENEVYSWNKDPKMLQSFQDQVLLTIADGALDHFWGFGLHVSGTTLWKIITTLEIDSPVLHVIFDLMDNGIESESEYVDLFQQYPSVAATIVQAMNHSDRRVQNTVASLLFQKAPIWFKEPISRHFAEAGLETSLASCLLMVNMGKTKTLQLIRAFEPRRRWKKDLMNAFYDSATSLVGSSTSSSSIGIAELTFEVWSELSSWDDPQDDQDGQILDRNWLSDDMLAVATAYLKNFIDIHSTFDSTESIPVGFGISPGALTYVSHVNRIIESRDSTSYQDFMQASSRCVELTSQS